MHIPAVYTTIIASLCSGLLVYSLGTIAGAFRQAAESSTLREMRSLVGQAQEQAQSAREARTKIDVMLDKALHERGEAVEENIRLRERVDTLERVVRRQASEIRALRKQLETTGETIKDK
ncbi:MAG: hypothetical protein P4L33_15715 [Capsulimonadaceae bacterium]|nr:hypothetical protein [Capsulimonadaceae bacterium]